MWLLLLAACADPKPPDDADGDGFHELDGDCDDADAAVYPGAVERCDGRDEDCDGTVDEDPVDPGTWYADVDGDGWGDPADVHQACVAPSQHIDRAGDCDDGDAAVNPDAAEVCDNGVDDDCDGGPGACVPTGERGVDGADATFTGTGIAHFGSTLAVIDDPDGDGFRAVVVGALDHAVDPEVPTAWIFDGPWGGARTEAQSDGEILGVQSIAANVPVSLAAGDLTGDGAADLLLGSFGDGEVGFPLAGYYVARGPLDGAVQMDQETDRLEPGGLLTVSEFGWAMVVVDGDGDGDADVAVGAPADGALDGGAVYVVEGLTETVMGRHTYTEGSGRFGHALARVPDLDGDGLDELAVGAPQADSVRGAVYLLAGPLDGDTAAEAARTVLVGPAEHAAFGAALAAADLDADGLADLVVGAPTDSDAPAGAAWFVAGADIARGVFTVGEHLGAPLEVSGVGAGTTVAVPGDMDGDGTVDVAVGAPAEGWVRVLYDPLGVGDHLLLVGTARADGLGAAMAGGDLDGDGRGDLVVGDPATSTVWLVRGHGG